MFIKILLLLQIRAEEIWEGGEVAVISFNAKKLDNKVSAWAVVLFTLYCIFFITLGLHIGSILWFICFKSVQEIIIFLASLIKKVFVHL